MIVGENSRSGDMDVNPTKEKKLTNIRTHSHDESLRLTPPRALTLEIGARVHRRLTSSSRSRRSRSGCASGPSRSTTDGARSVGRRTCAGPSNARPPNPRPDTSRRARVPFARNGAKCSPPNGRPPGRRRRDPGHPHWGASGRPGARRLGQAARPQGRADVRFPDPADRQWPTPAALQRDDAQRRPWPVRDPWPACLDEEALDRRPGHLPDRRRHAADQDHRDHAGTRGTATTTGTCDGCSRTTCGRRTARVATPRSGSASSTRTRRNLRLRGRPEDRADTSQSGCGQRGSLHTKNGISVGWGDLYPAKFAFQWIDVTGLPARDVHGPGSRSISTASSRSPRRPTTANGPGSRSSRSGSKVKVLASGTSCVNDHDGRRTPRTSTGGTRPVSRSAATRTCSARTTR